MNTDKLKEDLAKSPTYGVRYLALRSALKLEIKGLRMSRGPTAFSQIKDQFKLKGSKEKVLEQYTAILTEHGIYVPTLQERRSALIDASVRNPEITDAQRAEYAEEVAAGNHDGS